MLVDAITGHLRLYKFFNTQAGQDVVVTDETTGITLEFDEILTAGDTTITVTNSGPNVPGLFRLQPINTYYKIETTATFSGMIAVAFPYDDSSLTPKKESSLRLKHYDEALESWIDITTLVDTENNIIYGETPHFSYFAIMYQYMTTANIDINPKNIKLKSKGKYITVYIQLPLEYSASDIICESINMSIDTTGDLISIAPDAPMSEGDYNNDGANDLMVKFDRTQIYSILDVGETFLTVGGELASAELIFTGECQVSVMDKGAEHYDEDNHGSVLEIELQ